MDRTPRRRPNPVARALRSRALQPQKVRPRKGKGSYQRKDKHGDRSD